MTVGAIYTNTTLSREQNFQKMCSFVINLETLSKASSKTSGMLKKVNLVFVLKKYI